MSLETLRHWMLVHGCSVTERTEDRQLVRRYNDPAAKEYETAAIRAEMRRYREGLLAIARGQCPTCKWPLKQHRHPDFHYDECPKDILHFTSGFRPDGNFFCGLED